MRNNLMIFTLFIFTLISCKKEGDLVLGGTPTLIGAVGNTFTSSHSISGLSSVSAEVVELNDGVSVINATATVTNPDLANLANALEPFYPSNIEIDGNEISLELKMRFTDKGIASVTDDGEIILVKYDATVGDQYTATVGGTTITNTVISRSTEDDYSWGWLNIKVIEVESTGHNAGGLEKVTYYANHRFGLVGIKATFDNSNIVFADIFSTNEN
jgi:hypothetical protein